MKHIPHFWLENTGDLKAHAEITLSEAQSHHLIIVMRHNEGDTLTVANGVEGTWRAKIVKAHKKKTRIKITECIKTQENLLNITAFVPMISKNRMDWVWEKSVELGVKTIQPIITEYTQKATFKAEKIHKTLEGALGQCGGNVKPELRKPLHLSEALHQYSNTGEIYCAIERLDTSITLKTLMKTVDLDAPIGVMVGPEGGWSNAERTLLTTHNSVTPVYLGTRILRAETALSVMLSSFIQY